MAHERQHEDSRSYYLHQLLEILEFERPILVGVQITTSDVGGGKANNALPADLVEDEAVQGQNIWMSGETSMDLEFLVRAATALVVVGVLEDALFQPRVRDQIDMDG